MNLISILKNNLNRNKSEKNVEIISTSEEIEKNIQLLKSELKSYETNVNNFEKTLVEINMIALSMDEGVVN